MKKLWQKINAKIYIILPAFTFVCFVGFLLSLLIPDTVLDTYEVNMTEEEGEECLLWLGGNHYVYYDMDTGAKPLRGIQVGINKCGKDLQGTLHYDVYWLKDGKSGNAEGSRISENQYPLAEGADLQYVYLPFENYKRCTGVLRIKFYVTDGTEGPALMANHSQTENTETSYQTDLGGYPDDGSLEEAEAFNQNLSLKCSYIYTHETYPFLYDFRILTCIFLAASMAVQYPKRRGRQKGGKTNEK